MSAIGPIMGNAMYLNRIAKAKGYVKDGDFSIERFDLIFVDINIRLLISYIIHGLKVHFGQIYHLNHIQIFKDG